MSEKPIDDPCDDCSDVNVLNGWIYYDSCGMREKNNGEGLGGNRRDRYQNSRLRNDNG